MAIKSSNQITFSEHKKIIEIKEWYLAISKNTDVTVDTSGWTTDIQIMDSAHKYLWNYEEVIYSIGSSDISTPVIIGVYSQGEGGRGISNIKNYYQVTEELIVPDLPDNQTESSWSSTIPLLSSENKYLWNYEEIIYTDETSTMTDPALIGVYGDSGANAIIFEIYSSNGFMFKENLKSIELKVAAFDGDEEISDATYTWLWWDERLNDGLGDYAIIAENIAEKSFVINDTNEYALSNLKCVMTYNDKTYEDYILLSNEFVNYTSIVKFFDGRNIFNSDDLYLVAYVELYKNSNKIETISADKYCSGVSSVSDDGVITSSIDGAFLNGERMYFIYRDESGLYRAVLGEYQSGIWNTVTVSTKYKYTNSLYPNIQSNIIVISKESINKSANIDFVVFNDNVRISTINVNVIDSNDPIISSDRPENPVNGQLWLDTSSVPYILKIYSNDEWTSCTDKIGGAIFTSKPTEYTEGDLWILADGEVCGEFGPGSMLKAIETSNTFNTSHWIDADKNLTQLKYNIKQYFSFDSNTGLKIGQTDDKFYVNISSTEMGFYDNENGQHQKVVKISNNSAVIQNAKLKGNTEFYGQINICDPASNPDDNVGDTLFIWKVEANKSFSLAIAT